MQEKHEMLTYRINMATNALLDTNIIMDMFDADRLSHQKSLDLIKNLLTNGATLYVNSDTLTTAFYLLKNQKKATLQEALCAIRECSNICELIPIEKEDVEDTLLLCEDEKSAFKEYEDTLQYVCAKKVKADLMVTNDKGFVSLDIEVMGTS